MLKPFTTFFTFLHHNTKFLLTRRRRRRPNRSLFSSNISINHSLNTPNSSFVDMGVSNQFKQVFKIFDTNGDGKISAAELSEILLSLKHTKTSKKRKKSSTVQEAEGIIRVLDFNGDGFVDLDEFMVVMDGPEAQKYGSHDGEDDEKEEDELIDAFMIFDRDGNGVIDAKELQRVMVNLGCDNCSLRECKKMIQGVDKNGDGFVDFEEFRSMMKSSTVDSGVSNN